MLISAAEVKLAASRKDAPLLGRVGAEADAALTQPSTEVGIPAGETPIAPQTSQSPGVRTILVMSFAEPVLRETAPAKTWEETYSPMFPAAALSLVVVPGY